MKQAGGDRFRELQLAFIGKLMAGLSHEFKNHLAIIRELNGLTQDLLMLEEQGGQSSNDRLKKNCAGIEERITQAAEMCRFLSSFSHRMDRFFSSFSVADILQEECYLLHRFALQKQVSLMPALEEELPPVFNNPALLQFALFCIIWPALESLAPGGRITVAAAPERDSAAITVTVAGAKTEPAPDNPLQEVLAHALQLLGASLSSTLADDGTAATTVVVSSVSEPVANDR